MFRKINISSQISNHINRNIDQDRSDRDADIENLNINSPGPHDLEQHEASVNEAWHFINAARHQNFAHNEHNQIYSRNYSRHQKNDRRDIENENIDQKYINRPNFENLVSSDETSQNKLYRRNFCFSAINDYLDTLDNSSDEETPNIVEQNYFNNEDAPLETIQVYDGAIYAVSNDMLIYSYQNKNFTSEANDILINSTNLESQSNSTSSISVENLNEESVSYGKSFYTIPTSFHPIIIPRLPLTTYMLPTVTEILEPNRQSPKITEIFYEDNVTVKRKATNGWVMNNNDSSNSDANNTFETNVENSADESSPNKTKESYIRDNAVFNQIENHSKIRLVQEDKTNSDHSRVLNEHVDEHLKVSKTTFSPNSTGGRTTNIFYGNENVKHENCNIVVPIDTIEVDYVSKENIASNTSKQKRRISSPYQMELLSVHDIPKLHLSSNAETDTIEQSWFNRFIKCILCCK